MNRCVLIWVVLATAGGFVGCRSEVKTTKDSVKIEVDVPKIEVKKTPDLNPSTDDDVDVKTPGGDAK